MTEQPTAGAPLHLIESVADDPRLAPLIAAQEREVMERYGEDDAGPGAAPGSPAVLALLGDHAVGCVAVSIDGQLGEIKRMYVAPAARGRGLGRLLLDRVEALAAQRGVTTIRLETGTEQPEAMALYRRAGYEPIPCYGYWKDDPSTRCFEKRMNG